MVDSCNNEESEIYGAKAKRAHADKEYKAQIHLERKGYLALRCSSLATNGNILVPESILPRYSLTYSLSSYSLLTYLLILLLEFKRKHFISQKEAILMHYHLMKHIIVYFVVELKRVYQVTTYSLYSLTYSSYLLIYL